MRTGEASRTAEYMALFRALESRRPPAQRLFCDPLAAGFLTGALRVLAAGARLPVLRELIPRLVDRRNPGPRVSAVLRTRLIDDQLHDALRSGVRQVVLLGAGYDSRPYRIEEIGEETGVRALEVDHPTTQRAKRDRLAAMLGSLPPHVLWIPVDFLREDFGARLLDGGYSPATPTFFIWEGVTNYLDAGAVDATLRWIAGHSPGGSRLSFTYVDRGLLDGSVAFPGSERWVAAVERAGEPFTFGLDPAELGAYLAARGMRLLGDESTAAAFERLGAGGAKFSAPPAFYHVALAEVTDRP